MSFLCVKSLLLMSALLLAVSHCESTVEKLSSCCRAVSPLEIHKKITNIISQRKFGECVHAFIVQTETSLYCVSPAARWAQAEVQRIIKESERMKAASALPKVSLYTILSSSAAPPTPTPTPTQTSAQPSPVTELTAGETSAQPSPVSELSAGETSAQPSPVSELSAGETSAQPSPVSELSAGETSAQPSPVSELSAGETSAQPSLTHGSPIPPTADDEMPSENSI